VSQHVVTVLAQAHQNADASGRSPDLLVAILGGSVGVLLGAVARGLGIPSDVRTHDAGVADRDDALATWIADRDYVLRAECETQRRSVTPSPGLEPAADVPEHTFWEETARVFKATADSADRGIAAAKGRALHQYRDEARRARLDRLNILASEGWAHRAYRKITRQPNPELRTPQRATPVLDAWRKPSAISGGAQVWPDDATKRSLADAIASMPATGP
jgi:hypothetical protein